MWATPSGEHAYAIDRSRDLVFSASWAGSDFRSRSTSESPVDLVGGKADGRKVLYVLNFNNGTNARRNQPLALALSPDGKFVFVGVGGVPGTYKLDATAGELVALRHVRIDGQITYVTAVATLGGRRGLAASRSGKKSVAHVANYVSGSYWGIRID